MLEDKLTPEQRVRLESLAQSIALNAHRGPSSEKIISDAIRFEKYVVEGC